MSILAPFRSTSPRALEIWDEYHDEHKKWVRKVKRAEKVMAEAQGASGERASAWTSGKPNDDRYHVIGFSHLYFPREPGQFFGAKPRPIPPGWRMLADDECLKPIPANARRKGDDPNSPEAIAARQFLESVQPPTTLAVRMRDEFDMPIIVFNEHHIYWPAFCEVTLDGERVVLLAWGTDPKAVCGGKKGWNGGGGFTSIKTSEYYALRGE